MTRDAFDAVVNSAHLVEPQYDRTSACYIPVCQCGSAMASCLTYAEALRVRCDVEIAYEQGLRRAYLFQQRTGKVA